MLHCKKDFPVFSHYPDLVFLDSAASSQKPRVVLDALRDFSERHYANIHRGTYPLSMDATSRFEEARSEIALFFGASAENIAFTKNGTEASNILAQGIAQTTLRAGDEIILPLSEHHATILPWVRACTSTGAKVVFVRPNSQGVISLEGFLDCISEKTKGIVCAQVSNVSGQIFPLEEIVFHAKKKGIFTIVDACQSAPHIPVSFTELGVDAGFFTGHKIGAGGTGVLFIDSLFQEKIPPLLLGGDIVQDVQEEDYSLIDGITVYESGTPALENVIGLQSAVQYLKSLGGMDAVRNHEKNLIQYALDRLREDLPEWRLIGPSRIEERSGSISLFHPKIHHMDVGMILSEQNICVRTGFHCANPFHHFLQTSGSVRASVWVYNSFEDIDAWIDGMQKSEKMLGRER